jgi:hypothetical protein
MTEQSTGKEGVLFVCSPHRRHKTTERSFIIFTGHREGFDQRSEYHYSEEKNEANDADYGDFFHFSLSLFCIRNGRGQDFRQVVE